MLPQYYRRLSEYAVAYGTGRGVIAGAGAWALYALDWLCPPVAICAGVGAIGGAVKSGKTLLVMQSLLQLLWLSRSSSVELEARAWLSLIKQQKHAPKNGRNPKNLRLMLTGRINS